ncbi:MAG: NAD(P)(+) transhydrogenase (Re/Si-specific) subunit beta, partial [Acidimicrobiales bacterium]
MSRGTAIDLCYLVAAIGFIVALKGLSSPRRARAGNLLAAGGMALAIGATFARSGLSHIWLIVIAMVLGVLIGVPAARLVKMTAMPQMVAV